MTAMSHHEDLSDPVMYDGLQSNAKQFRVEAAKKRRVFFTARARTLTTGGPVAENDFFGHLAANG